MATTWTLTPEEWDRTRRRIEKINTRAVKRGFTGMLGVTGERKIIVETGPDGVGQRRVVFDVEITGTAAAYGGWEFLAAVDALPVGDGDEVGFVIRCAPGVDDAGVDRSTLVPGRCEHCNTAAANRKYTYLVREVETGNLRQVGSTCIKDFTGWQGKPVFLAVDGVEDDLFGERCGARPTPATTVEDAIATAYVAVQMFGWAASSDAQSTRSTVGDALFGTDRISCELRAAMHDRMSEGIAISKEIITTITTELTDPHGYQANLRTVLSAPYVTTHELGLLCSAIPVYERIIGRRLVRNQASEQASSRWFATVGEKVTVTGAVRTALTIGGYAYNTTQRLIIIETPGAVFKTTTTAEWAWEVKGGEIITVTATVKRHDLYRELEQTVLVRPKLIRRATADDMGATINAQDKK